MTQAPQNMEMRATVIRCSCGLKEYEPNHQCPKGEQKNYLLAYYSKNPFKHYFFNFVIKLQELERKGYKPWRQF